MGTMRFVATSVLLFMTTAIPALSAELSLRVDSNRFNYRLSDEPVLVIVSIGALEASEKALLKPNALDYVDFTLKSAKQGEILVRATPVGPSSHGFVGRSSRVMKGIDQREWSFSGQVQFPALPAGEYTLEGKYFQATGVAKFTVWNGDENDTVKAAKLGRDAELTKDFGTFRSLQLARHELQPNTCSILWELAMRAESEAPLEETDRYYAQAAAIARENVESEEFRAQVTNIGEIEDEVAVFERVVAAVRAVLPAFYKDRNSLYIEKPMPRTDATVRLMDRKTNKPVMVVDGFTLDPAAVRQSTHAGETKVPTP